MSGETARTEAGRALVALDEYDTASLDDADFLRIVLRIEAEAVAAERERLRVAVEGLPALTRVSTIPPEHHLVQRSAVLALLTPDAP